MSPVAQRKLILALLVVLSTAVSSQAQCTVQLLVGGYTKAKKANNKGTVELCNEACAADDKCAHFHFFPGCAGMTKACAACWLSDCDGVVDIAMDEAVYGPKVCGQDKCAKPPVPPVPAVAPGAATTSGSSSFGADSSSIPTWLLILLILLLCCCCCLPLLGIPLGIIPFLPKKKKTKKVIRPAEPLLAPEVIVAPPVMVAAPMAQPMQTMSMVARPVQTMQMVAQPVATAAPAMSSYTTMAAPATSSFTTTAVATPMTGYSTGGYPTTGYTTGGYGF